MSNKLKLPDLPEEEFARSEGLADRMVSDKERRIKAAQEAEAVLDAAIDVAVDRYLDSIEPYILEHMVNINKDKVRAERQASVIYRLEDLKDLCTSIKNKTMEQDG